MWVRILVHEEKWPTKMKKDEEIHVFKSWMFSLGPGGLWRLKALHGGL
jgi:hypothetical protein